MSASPSRFTVALDLACAAITVLLSGHVAEQMEQQPDTRPAQATRPPAKLSPSERRRTGKRYSLNHHSRLILHLRHGSPHDIVNAGIVPTLAEVYRAMRGGGACDIRIRCALRTLQSLYRWHPIMRPEGFASWQEELKFRDEINAAALSCFVEASQ